RMRATGRRPYLMGPGGSSSVGCLGYVNAAMELAEQVRAGEVPAPDAIYVALGSGATAVGLALGLVLSELPTPIIGVRATDRVTVNRGILRAQIELTARRLRHASPGLQLDLPTVRDVLRVDDSELGQGYGHETPTSRLAMQAAAEEGLVLDGTYTAKAFAALLRAARGPREGEHLL